MDNRDEGKAFLGSRRAKITLGRAGLPTSSRNRRVPGLRRSEVADLAGAAVAMLRTDRPTSVRAWSGLSIRSDDFRSRCGAHNVQIHSAGVNLVHHPVVEDLDHVRVLAVAPDLSRSLLDYTAEPGSRTERAQPPGRLAADRRRRSEVVADSTDDSVPPERPGQAD